MRLCAAIKVEEALGGGLNACCGASGSLRIAKLLLGCGANASYMGQEFEASPVHRAIQFGHDNLVVLLLTHKVTRESRVAPLAPADPNREAADSRRAPRVKAHLPCASDPI